MALQSLSFDKDKDALIARLLLQRIQVFLECEHTEDLFSKNEADVINKFAIASDKEHYSLAMNHINSRHYIDSHAVVAEPLILEAPADTPAVSCDAIAISCD